ncbi:hypothetical protein [Natrialba taiwanensis]|uniref:Uncharacterized protein n=1 Tax=Natrialba taiwanensis DSM 12281 TaxID=1230458 RepID=M0AB09_9EURY|nr:hypothetical protein [Natrialba taiwanensis]ELY95581.1 hypothetical protein C484_04820 [Natrialba taiwanensis DSM 12281]
MTDDQTFYRRKFLGTAMAATVTVTAGCLDWLSDEEYKYENKARITIINSHYDNETTTFEFAAKAENGTTIYEDTWEVTKSHSFTSDPILDEVRTINYRTDNGADGNVSIPAEPECPPHPSVSRKINLYYGDRKEMTYREDVPSCD